MINRIAQQKLLELAGYFKVVSVNGPRQSGKTTLVKNTFKSKPYVSLENPDERLFALEDPRGFLQTYSSGAIFDEIQRAPLLFSYLQEIVDNSNSPGQYILTGSNNFLLQENITQSLAGRVGHLTLLPFSMNEINNKEYSDNDLMLKGFYPPIYDQNIPFHEWIPNYIKTYIEKDVRQIKNISDLLLFEKFVRVLAGRCSQEVNYTNISNEIGIDTKTVQSWIGILVNSYLIFLLKPHYKNFNKTIVKRPKLYFIDTAIACSLLNIKQNNHIQNHPLRGALFENMVISEALKNNLNKGLENNLYYWRDKTGHEVDLIVEEGVKQIPIEIKSSATINSTFFKNLNYWNKLRKEEGGLLLYSGVKTQQRSNNIKVMNWRDFNVESN